MRQLKITKQVTNRETASLDKYLQEIGKVDLISADEEVELAKKIKEGYHTTVITTKQGEVITGGLVRDSDSELVIRMVDGSFKNIKTSVIEKKEISPVSLMPPGLTASLRKDEFIDLMSFLSALGKEGGYKAVSYTHLRAHET